MRRPRRFTVVTVLVSIAGAVLLGMLLARTVASLEAADAARDQRDRAMNQVDDALDELERVRRDAVADRREFQARITGLEDRIDDLLGEARLLRAQVDALSGQVRDLGGEPAPPPQQLEEPDDPPDDFEPAGTDEPADAGGLEAAAEDPHPSDVEGRPPHAGRQGPPDHSNRGGSR